MYSSSLDCQPALVGNNSDGVTYDNGKGCVVEDIDIGGIIPTSTSLFSSYYQTSCNGGTTLQLFFGILVQEY